MKQDIRFTRQLLSVITAGLMVTVFAGNAYATGAKTEAATQAGATAGTHMSGSGTANSNAQWQSDAAKGDARAAVRMNAKGAENKHDGSADIEAAASAKRKP